MKNYQIIKLITLFDLTVFLRSILCLLMPLNTCSGDTRPCATSEVLKSSVSGKMTAKFLIFWVKSLPLWAYALSLSNSSNPPTFSTLSYSSRHSVDSHPLPNSNFCLSCSHAFSTLPDCPHSECWNKVFSTIRLIRWEWMSDFYGTTEGSFCLGECCDFWDFLIPYHW